jgi:hypothetical protein
MAWTETTRAKYRPDGLRYASDTTDEAWATLVKRSACVAGEMPEEGLIDPSWTLRNVSEHRSGRYPVCTTGAGP